ncbi:MAG: class I SAM-dependent methyltransferase [Actinobacteria bacterium]|nr:class I SAM-dependent methyltransferase [Actinomycetota bacterium]
MRVGALRDYEDALTSSRDLDLVTADGRRLHLDVRRWLAPADAADGTVLRRCVGPTLDVGCGPGRLVGARAGTGQITLGVDIAAAAVELTARRGAPVLRRDVFDRVPGEGRWQTILLVDGNVGIGGDVGLLLRRLRDLLGPGGQLLVEADPRPDADEVLAVRFAGRPDDPAFDWAVVGGAALARHAARAGLRHVESWESDGRSFLRLVR